MEDGVLWTPDRHRHRRQGDRGGIARRARPESGSGDMLLAIDGMPLASTDDVVSGAARGVARVGPDAIRCCGMQGSSAAREHRGRADAVRRARPVLRAGGRRHLLAAGRRGGPAPASGSPGHAAFLLAEHRVLRRCSRSRSAAGSTSLDWVFYWGDIASRLLLPPLFVHFALVFPERPDSWVRSDAGRAAAAAAVSAGAAARRRARSRLVLRGALAGRRAVERRRRSSSAASWSTSRSAWSAASRS